MERQGQRARSDLRVLKVPQEGKVRKACQELKGPQGRKADQVRKGHRDRRATPELRDPQERQGLQDQPDRLGQADQQERTERRDLQGRRVRPGSLSSALRIGRPTLAAAPGSQQAIRPCPEADSKARRTAAPS
jgi:hypothetical protein